MTREEARNLVVEKGEIILISNGEYSDYRVLGVYKALRQISAEVITLIWNQLKATKGYFLYENIVEELVRDKYIKMVNTRELYLGGYGDLDLGIREMESE